MAATSSHGPKSGEIDEKGPGFKVVSKKEYKISLLSYIAEDSGNTTKKANKDECSTKEEQKKVSGPTGSSDLPTIPSNQTEIKKRQLRKPISGYVLSDVLSKSQCNQLLAGVRTSGHSYTFWNPDAPDRKDTRNVDTVEVRDEGLAGYIWERVKTHVEPVVVVPPDNEDWEYGLEGRWEACGINPVLLFGRYSPGGHFSPHTDGHVIVDFNQRSMYSVILYLNDCAKGGSTQLFYPEDAKNKKFVQDESGRFRYEDQKIADSALPRVGSMLAFSQHHMHEGEPVGEGCFKYIIRTDIMYKRVPPVCDSPRSVEAYKCFQAASEAEGCKEYVRACDLYSKCSRLSEKLARMLNIYDGS